MTAILFIHGFMGRSSQFDEIIRLLDTHTSDTKIIKHILPGHEADIKAFCASSSDQWQQSVDAHLDQLRRSYERIIIVGHSMGGLLAIVSAAQNPDKIARIIAIALPLRLHLTAMGIYSRVRSIGRHTAGDPPEVAAARNFCGVGGITALNSPLLLGPTLDLLKVIKRAQKRLAALCVPLSVINSNKDDIVSPGATLAALKLKADTQIVPLERASHFWFPENETLMIARIIQACI